MKWEYFHIGYDLSRLKELGMEGWELVTIDSGGQMFFKRPWTDPVITRYIGDLSE